MRLMFLRLVRPVLLWAVLCSLTNVSWAFCCGTYNWTFAARWNEVTRSTSGGVTTYPEEFYPYKEYDVRPHQQLRSMFPGAIVGNGNNKATSDNLWIELLQSKQLYGNSTSRTRGRDVSEDWDLQFIDPSDTSKLHWFNWYVDNTWILYVDTWSYPVVMANGPHAGESWVGNNDLLAMGDNKSVWIDVDGSLSFYHMGVWGLIDYDPTNTTFTGGDWAGQTVRSKLSMMIGYESSPSDWGALYFLEGASTLRVFDRNLNFVRKETFKFGPGDLSAYTLGDVVDDLVPGYTYVGWDWGPIIVGVTSVRPNMNKLHHIELSSSSSSGLTCTPNTFTIKACQDAACSTPYTTGLTGTLSLAGSGATVNFPSGSGFTISPGNSQTTLTAQVTTVPSAGYVVAGLTGLSITPTGSPTVYCGMGTSAVSGGSCNFTVNSSGLLFSIANHVSEVSQAVTVTAVKSSDNTAVCVPAFASVSKNVTFACSYSNPATGTLPVRVGGVALNAANSTAAACDASGRAVSLSFNASGVASTTVQYADVGQIAVTGKYTGVSGADAGLIMTGSASAIVAPKSFAVAVTTASPIAAGADFSATVTAKNNAGSATPNFGKETAPQTPTLTFSKASPTGTGAQNGVFAGSFGAFTGGVATASNLKWSEVGTADLNLALSSYLGSGMSVSGSTGTTGLAGRFIPHHFNVTAPSTCGAFTYGGQPFALTVTAVNATEGTTANYDGSGATSPNMAKDVTISVTNGGTGTVSNNGDLFWSAFKSGEAKTSVLSFNFAAKLTAPLVGGKVRATEKASAGGDGVSSSGYDATMSFRSGRLKVSNSFGSEKSNLLVPVQAQYWNGKAWVINSLDGCTSLTAASVVLARYYDYKGASTSAWTSTPSAVTISGGNGTLTLTAPSPAGVGSLDFSFNLGGTSTGQSCLSSQPSSTGANLSWLRAQNGSTNGCTGVSTYDRDPSARATFGVYAPETKKMVFTRDIY
ncbi:MAG: hypothetical protein Q7U28_18305 [Aquabacterium sp.]|nr:hypothetical protein [Aquabacterium sp.]